MTEVSFHFNAPDRLAYACRLLRKAYNKGARLVVLADAPTAVALDQQLWTMGGTEFVPHCSSSAEQSLRRHSAIVISSGEPAEDDEADVLVNLRDQLPNRFERFSRVIEVVTADADVRNAARERWKQYKAAGHDPQHLDIRQSMRPS